MTGPVMLSGGVMSSGTRLVDQARTSFRRLGDRWGVAAALSSRGWKHFRPGGAARR
jgi:hypothetical protein